MQIIILIQIIKWMPPYWDNKALTRYFIFNFLIISFIFIENKCLSDVIWDLKRGKKGEFELGSIVSESTRLTIYATETDVYQASFLVLTAPITRWWAELV